MQFLSKGFQMPQFMSFPKFLLDNTNLNETEKILYTILLDRNRISLTNPEWIDDKGYAFIIYTIKALADIMHKSKRTISTSLDDLEKEKLIYRKYSGACSPNKIYVAVPEVECRMLHSHVEENFTPIVQKTASPDGRKLRSNNININNTSLIKEENKRYGTYLNVILKDSEVRSLKADISDLGEYIEKLSVYIQSTGKQYASHSATIRNWALKDNKIRTKKNYDCTEEESL